MTDEDEVATTLTELTTSLKSLLVEIGKFDDGERPDTHRLRNIAHAMLLNLNFLQDDHAQRQHPKVRDAVSKRTGRGPRRSTARPKRPKSR